MGMERCGACEIEVEPGTGGLPRILAEEAPLTYCPAKAPLDLRDLLKRTKPEQ